MSAGEIIIVGGVVIGGVLLAEEMPRAPYSSQPTGSTPLAGSSGSGLGAPAPVAGKPSKASLGITFVKTAGVAGVALNPVASNDQSLVSQAAQWVADNAGSIIDDAGSIIKSGGQDVADAASGAYDKASEILGSLF